MTYTARVLFMEFRKEYPELWRRGTTYSLSGYMTIEVLIPDVGKLIYSKYDNSLVWLERRANESEYVRPELYNRFCIFVRAYIRDHNMTYQEFADYVSVSRQSLSKYLNGDRMPKVSTMRNICRQIKINI